MTTAEMIRRFFKRASVDLDPAADEAVFDRIRAAYVKASENGPAESRPVLWRHIMRRPLTQWGIAAAVIMAGLIGLSFWRGTGSGIVLADVLTRVEQVSAFLYQTKTTRTGQEDKETRSTSLKAQGLGTKMIVERFDPNTGQDRIEQEMYLLLKQRAMVMIMHDQKRYVRMDFDDQWAQQIRKQVRDPRDLLSRLQACKYKSLGRSTMEGVAVEGFQTTDPNYLREEPGPVDVRIWVALATRLPVRTEEVIQLEDGTQRHAVSTQFQWNVPIDPVQFEPVIPDGYTSPVNGPVALPSMNEESAIAGLRLCLELTGQYPEAIDYSVMALGDKLLELEGATKEQLRDDKVRLTKVMGRMMQLGGLLSFQAMLAEENKEPAYYGDRVTPEFPHAVLMRWKVDDGHYRVLFGDLSRRDVTEDELARLEASPLNLKPLAVRPQPADGSQGYSLTGLQLQWMPGLGAVEHRVYLGDSPNSLALIAVVKDPNCPGLPALQKDTQYYWRVDEVQADGSVVQGEVWTLKTGTLVGWWRFDESTGTTAHDEIGTNDANLYHMDDSSWVGGIQGNALRFDGIDDYIEIPRLIQNDWTISLWINTTQTGSPGSQWWQGHGLVDGKADGPAHDFGTSLLDDRVAFGVGSPAGLKAGTTMLSATAVNDGQWHHVVATRQTQSGQMRLYIDGRQEAAATGPKGTKDEPSTLRIGAIQPDRGYFKGDIDEVRLYTYALSDDEVAALYQEQAP